jgi:CTP:molybdopterin cytidylyltransferase MocA
MSDGCEPVGAIVLAAGAGSRFGGGKLLAKLDGRAILQHVLDTVAALRFGTVVVVLGRDAEAIERSLEWRRDQRVVNAQPERGLSTSVQLGFTALQFAPVEAALVVLGDQPRLSPAVVRALVGASLTDARPVAVPRYADGSGSNPLLLLRSAWPLVDTIDGDRGLGPLLGAHPALVLEVPVDGSNPDVDTRQDLARLSGEASA